MVKLRSDGVKPRILHAGCGGDRLPAWLSGDEIRLDIDPGCDPDICESMDSVPEKDGSFDAVFCSHALEHLTPEGAERAATEFARLLTDGGCAFLFVPDTEGVDPEGREPLFISPDGPITGWELFNGRENRLATMPYMRHLTAFTESSLRDLLYRAGFRNVETKRLHGAYNLFAVAKK